MKRARLVKPTKTGPAVKESVQVFCRVRPHPDRRNSDGDGGCLKIVPPCHVHLILPQTATRSAKELQYSFRKVFEESTAQKEVFEEVALPQIRNLLAGRNSLLFTYGVTGSGKTYTMTGLLRDGGIMPRCFDAIFDSVGDTLARKNIFKPDKMNSFEIQSIEDADAEEELRIKVNMAKMNKLEKKTSDPDLAQRVRDEAYNLPVDGDNCFAVFITYVEIYNNNVYDLLEDVFEENTRVRPLQTKIVREDSNHNMFVHGVNEIEVSSTDEAYEAYLYGQKRRRIAQTALNAESSRSHSVFTIRLVQAPCEDLYEVSTGHAKNNMVVSQLSLVDLAGSERTNRTKNTGKRLKEAGNINNSLLTLRVCLETLRDNQNGGNRLAPYRDSRLTHLFRSYFEGDGQVSMIICISPLIEECEETMQVLKFAEMSQEITTVVQTPLRNICDPGRKRALDEGGNRDDMMDLAAKEFDALSKAGGDFLSTSRVEQLFDGFCDLRFFESSDDKEMIATNRRILDDDFKKFEAMKENLDLEMIRGSIVQAERGMYLSTLKSKQLESQFDSEKEKVISLEAKLRALETEQLRLKRKADDSESVIKKLKTEISSKDMVIRRKNQEQDKVKEEFASKMVQAQDKHNRDLERKLKTQKQAWENEIKHQEGRMRMARQVLASEKNLPAFVTPARSRIPPSKSVESIPSSTRGITARTALFGGTPSISAVTNAPCGTTGAPRPTPRKGVPVVNRRYRRSRSCDNDVWLEHRPVHEVPSNTVMQPVMTKRKSITKLTDSKDVTEKTSKYCLLTQNQDSDGDLETRLYKADVIPTAGGGAQVMFNDVEVLKQMSPNGSPSRKTPGQIRQDWEAVCAQSATDSQRTHHLRSRNRRD